MPPHLLFCILPEQKIDFRTNQSIKVEEISMTSAFGLFPFRRCGNQGRQRPRIRSRQRQSWGRHRTFPALSPGASHLHRAGQPFSVQGQGVSVSAFDRRPQSPQFLHSALPGNRKAAFGAIQMNEGRPRKFPFTSTEFPFHILSTSREREFLF